MSGNQGHSGNQGQSVHDMATQVVRTDMASQKAVEEQEKGTWTPKTGIGYIPDWSQRAPAAQTGWAMWQKALVVLTGVILLLAGGFIGYNLLKGQPGASPQPTLIAAPPTSSPTPSSSSSPSPPVQPGTQPPLTPTPAPPITPSPAVITPAPVTPSPVPTPVPIVLPEGVAEVVTGPPVSYADLTDDQAKERPDDPDVDPQPQTEFVGGYVAPGGVEAAQALAGSGSFIASVTSDRVNELWPCIDAEVICGPETLEPGDYFVIGFNTAAAPPTEGTDGIYQVFYLMTDIENDYTDNAYVTPPLTNYIYLSAEYVIEGGFFGTTSAVGETDYGGPVGPDGQTPRYNIAASSRLVISADPPGGFFIVPQDRIGNWFRISSMWRDFNATERHILVDSVGLLGNLELIPVPGRAALETLSCVRVDVVGEALGEQPSQLEVFIELAAGVAFDADPTANVTILSGPTTGTTTIEPGPIALEDLGNGAYSFSVGVPNTARTGFQSVSIGPISGADVDITEEVIALGGAGVNVPPDFSGYAMGTPECGT